MDASMRERAARRCRERGAVTSTAIVIFALLSLSSAPLAGQDPGEGGGEAPRVASLSGVVMDARTGTRLEGARVEVVGVPRGTLTDSVGTFRFDELPVGHQRIVVDHYGFEAVTVTLSLEPGQADPVHIELTPYPVMLEGMEVVAERLETMESRMQRRRRATAASVRAFDLARLTDSPSWDMLDFLKLESSLHTMPCERAVVGGLCILRRGRWTRPRVFIDEMPAIGGMEQLSMYRPQDFYLVEVYASGLQIRAYTHNFMERMARQPVALSPIFIR